MSKTVKVLIELADNGWMIRNQHEYSDISRKVETELPIALMEISKLMLGEKLDASQLISAARFIEDAAIELLNPKIEEPKQPEQSDSTDLN